MENEILDKINEMVSWYHKNCTKATPEQLLASKDKLVTLNYNLAEIVAEQAKNYHKSYYIRKLTIARKKNAYIKSGEAVSKAESLATEEAANEFEQELELEALALRYELLLKQSNKIVDAIQQRVSYLKIEMHRAVGAIPGLM